MIDPESQGHAALPPRTEESLRQRQRRGQLRARSAADFRRLVVEAGLAEAYHATDVVVAANAEFTDQASLHLTLGPTDPPIRFRETLLGGLKALTGGGGGELVLPIGGGLFEGQNRGGGEILAELLQGRDVEFNATGSATAMQPRREIHTKINLDRIGTGRLILHRGVGENGIVAVSSAEGVLRTPYGPLLGPFGNALYTCSGADSIGLAMPGLSLLGPGSPIMVGGGIGWVIGCGTSHQPCPRRLPSGHARTPGAVAALCVDLVQLQPQWVRSCFFEGQGSALLVALAAPIPLINGAVATKAAVGDDQLEAPVLDLSVPRRIKPNLGRVSYRMLRSGNIRLGGRTHSAAPAHSPRLAASMAGELIHWLEENRFPLCLPWQPLSPRPALIPLDP